MEGLAEKKWSLISNEDPLKHNEQREGFTLRKIEGLAEKNEVWFKWRSLKHNEQRKVLILRKIEGLAEKNENVNCL